MWLERLQLEDFRNYEHVEIDLRRGLTLVVGQNAQGKTNFLEALYCLGGLGSPRGADAVVVRAGGERAVLHARVARGARRIELDLEIRPGRRRALVNKTPVRSARALAEVFTAVFFGPDELSLIKGSPDGRRRFVDDLVVKLRPARSSLRRDWERAVRQKNALLRREARGARTPEQTVSTLDAWDQAVARTGAALTAARLRCLEALLPAARRRFRDVAGAGTLELTYQSTWLPAGTVAKAVLSEPPTELELMEQLERALKEARPRELERGMALVGPQRDDIGVRLSSSQASAVMDARSFASQGEQRTAALALKLGEFDVIEQAFGEQPVLLLDDVFSELDPRRRRWLADAVQSLDQTIVTAAEPGATALAEKADLIEVSGGRLTR